MCQCQFITSPSLQFLANCFATENIHPPPPCYRRWADFVFALALFSRSNPPPLVVWTGQSVGGGHCGELGRAADLPSILALCTPVFPPLSASLSAVRGLLRPIIYALSIPLQQGDSQCRSCPVVVSPAEAALSIRPFSPNDHWSLRREGGKRTDHENKGRERSADLGGPRSHGRDIGEIGWDSPRLASRTQTEGRQNNKIYAAAEGRALSGARGLPGRARNVAGRAGRQQQERVDIRWGDTAVVLTGHSLILFSTGHFKWCRGPCLLKKHGNNTIPSFIFIVSGWVFFFHQDAQQVQSFHAN